MPSKNARRAGKVSIKAKPHTPYVTPVFKGAKTLGWDKKATLHQNYAKMQLVADPNKQELRPDPEGVPRQAAPIEALVEEARVRFTPLPAPMMNELRPLIQKYGKDTRKMARDRKLNRWQRTDAQLATLVAKFHATQVATKAKESAEQA